MAIKGYDIVFDKEAVFQWILLIAVVVLSVFSCQQYHDRRDAEHERNSTKNFLTAQLEVFKNKEDKWQATKASLAGDKNQLEVLLDSYIDSTGQLNRLVKKYKNIASVEKIRIVTQIDSVFIPFNNPMDLDFDFIQPFEVDNPWYSISGRAHNKGLDIDNLTLRNNMSFVLGKKKNGWFKTSTFSIDVVNSNPHITVTGADSYQFTPKPKRWSIGPYVGYDPFMQRISAGVSLQYGIIRF